jgi:tetratricopeptide (TPR) repeat protein
MFVTRIANRHFPDFFLAVVLLVSLGSTVADGRDLTVNELEALGRHASRRGAYGEAARHFRLALELAEKREASETDLVLILANLAEMLRSAMQYGEAEKFFDRALAILRTSNAADKRNLPVILGNQGRLYQETGRYALSEPILKEALRLTERDLGTHHRNMVTVLNSLGVLYKSIKKRKDAETSFKKAIALEEKREVQDGYIGPILGNLAGLYQDERRWNRAAPLLVRALGIVEASYGAVHPETATILNKLGTTYYRQGKLEDAARTFRRTLEAQRNLFGTEDRTVAMTSFTLARLLAALGNYDDAKSRYIEALQVLETNLGLGAPEVAATLEEFAKLMRKMKNSDEAFAMEARAKFIRAEQMYKVRVPNGGRE